MRIGTARLRIAVQVKSPLRDKETKRDESSGKFMAQKQTGKFKGFRREN